MRWIVGINRARFAYISKGWIGSRTICHGNKGGSGRTTETDRTRLDRIQTMYNSRLGIDLRGLKKQGVKLRGKWFLGGGMKENDRKSNERRFDS